MYLFEINRYGVVIDGERGNRPHILSQEELLNQAVSVHAILPWYHANSLKIKLINVASCLCLKKVKYICLVYV